MYKIWPVYLLLCSCVHISMLNMGDECDVVEFERIGLTVVNCEKETD